MLQSLSLFFAQWMTRETYHDRYARIVQMSLGMAFSLTGLVFYSEPQRAMQVLGLECRDENGIVEVKAFYGLMEVFLGTWLGVVANCDAALTLGACLLAGSSAGRVWGWFGHVKNVHRPLLHLQVGLAESLGACICAGFAYRECRVKAQKEWERFRKLTRRQIPNPQSLDEFVPFCNENLQDPYPFYQCLRDQAPVYKPDGVDFYLVSKASDIRYVCKSPGVFSSNLVSILLAGPSGSSSELNLEGMFDRIGIVDALALQDPPIHTHQRKFAMNGLNPKLFARLDDTIRTKCNELLDRHFPNSDANPVDWMDAIALRLPMTIALELCGFPSDDDTARMVKEQADHGVALMSGINTPEDFAKHVQQGSQLFFWVKEQFQKTRENATTPPTEFISSLIQGVETKALSVSECESMILQILLAGNDSSASTIGQCIKTLCEHPGIVEALRKDPDTNIPAFIEEILRFESPFHGHFRKVTKACQLGQVELQPGDRLFLLWASGNRDEEDWDRPEDFVWDRFLSTDGKPCKSHFSFGHGIHNCLGNSLARREARIVVEQVLAKFEHQIKPSTRYKSYYIPSTFTRCLASYHLILE